MIKTISILGSTGSIGTQTLDAVDNLGITVTALAAGSNIGLLEKQIRKYRPKVASIGSEELARELKCRIADIKCEIYYGVEGLIAVATQTDAQMVVTSLVGVAGLIPTIEAIKAKKHIALANKETLVAAGQIVMSLAKENGVSIIPVDSEHSAIFQCLMGNEANTLNKIILTASGGPFRGYKIDDLSNVTLEQALKHPNWSMGSKITIDSATMMNKGLEVIEAKWLFNLSVEQIEVIVHPQSIIHSMIEYSDGSIIAQLGSPDMRLPIQFALTYPNRIQNNFSKLDFKKISELKFEEPDLKTFKCLAFAFDALRVGGLMPVVLNASNEIAVDNFLRKRIRFSRIWEVIEIVIDKYLQCKHSSNISPSIDDIIEIDNWARNESQKIINT